MLAHLDPHTNQCELEVQRIIHLQAITNQLLDVLTDNKKDVKSQIPTANTPTQIQVLEGKIIDIAINDSKAHLKYGRSVNAKTTLEEENKRKTIRSP